MIGVFKNMQHDSLSSMKEVWSEAFILPSFGGVGGGLL
jgi:hypothetical protein